MVFGMHFCRAAHWEGAFPWKELHPVDKVDSGASRETDLRWDEHNKEPKCVEVYIGTSAEAQGPCKLLYKIWEPRRTRPTEQDAAIWPKEENYSLVGDSA